jgi:predicted hydrocarbon binding protein
MNRNFVLESWWFPLRAMGYGTWKLNQTHRDRGLLQVSLRNSMIAKSMEQLGKPVCHMSAGFFAGFFSTLDGGDEVAAVEVECYAMGHDCCQFLICKPELVRRAEAWRRQGDTADEIIQKLLV